jgi:hypothetical protein
MQQRVSGGRQFAFQGPDPGDVIRISPRKGDNTKADDHGGQKKFACYHGYLAGYGATPARHAMSKTAKHSSRNGWPNVVVDPEQIA